MKEEEQIYEGKIYDEAGNEIKIKAGHRLVMVDRVYCETPIDYTCNLIYRPPPVEGSEGPIAQNATLMEEKKLAEEKSNEDKHIRHA